ncbi:potassium channel family protein [Lachnobacterium bovis]|uniref:Trk system potassium uptake protein TrkA n=1 Tax=Lachnobacterium bovis TaxID=140626 RepID=A0A1H9U066_9FIRM|nr:TrkA family potassium uptake protein [Lachnobacterium bovis]SES02564.1 trk system potassium uptake protein TrkA [Lachnobacterium bovis]
MKNLLIIGMGRFGHHLCNNLIKLDNNVTIVDKEEANVTDMMYKVGNVQIGDCTIPKVVKSLNLEKFDIVFVCIGTSFQNSLEVTSLIKEMGAKYVISKANRDVQAKFLLKNGADEVIYPDRDLAFNLAKRCSTNHVFDYMELTDDYSLYEIEPLADWIGKTIKEIGIRQNYSITIIGIRNEEGTDVLPSAEYRFNDKDHLIVVGRQDDIEPMLGA